MKTSHWLSSLLLIFTLTIHLVACGVATPVPVPVTETSTVTASSTPSITPSFTPSVTPSFTPSITPTITFTPTPNFCDSAQWQEKIQVVSTDMFTAIERGGPPLLDQVLVEQNPAWADFQQYSHGELRSAGIIIYETAFGPPSPELGLGVNPAVLLVTYGVDKNWELPANSDLESEVDNIRAILHQRQNYWTLGIIDLDKYSMLANGATYALYYYFDGDLSKLEEWCRTYVRVFNKSPLENFDR